MSDPHVDQFESVGYGHFTPDQIRALVIGVEPAYDSALEHTAVKVEEATTAIEEALEKTEEHKLVTYSQAASEDDPVGVAKDTLTRACKYAESRPNGTAIASKMLNGESVTTIKRRRPAKLIAALDHAIKQVVLHKLQLPEYATWSADLTAARNNLSTLDDAVRKTRTDGRQMTPEVQAAHAAWMTVYGAAKLIVEGVLKVNNRLGMMPEVFDDLAEVHRVAGVSDEVPGTATETAATPK